MAEYLDKNGLEDVASKVNSRLKTVTTMPEFASDGAVRLYVGASGQTYVKGHVYQYSQSGSEWQDITPSIGGISDYEQLQNLPSINGKVLVGNADGKTYSLVNRNELPESVEQNTSFLIDYLVYSFCIFNNTLYVCTNHGIYTSTNGVTFTQNTSFPTGNVAWSFCIFNNTLYVGDLGDGIYTSTDGSTFTKNTSFPNYLVYSFCIFNNTLYVGTSSHGIYTSTDGSTFTQNTSFPTGDIAWSFCIFKNTLYVGNLGQGIYTSTDGSTFTQNTSFPSYGVRAFCVYNNTLYIGTSGHGIYTSTDGVTFTQNTSFPIRYEVWSFCVYNNTLYVGTDNHGIYKSTDGSTFTQNTSFPTSYTVRSFCVFNNTLYVGTSSHGIYTIDFKLAYDDVPTENSKALMTSGAIQNTLAKLNWDVLPPRFLKFAFGAGNNKSLIIKGGTTIRVGSNLFHVDLDTSYMMSDLMQGRDYFVYLNYLGGSWSLTCTITKSADISASRCIGRFHTLCAAVPAGTTMILPDSPGSGRSAGDNILVKSYRQDSDPDFYAFYNKTISSVESGTYYDVVTCEHPLAGFSAGDILPESVWCLNWKPDTLHEDAMVYDKDTGIAVDVYLQSGTGLNTKSVYGAAHTVSRQQWNHQGDMLAVGKKLLRDYEFSSAALGSNECTNIAGSADAGTVGGHSDTNGRRMISAIGCAEMCGYLWQWLDEVNGKPDENTWTVTDGQGAFGQEYWQPRALLAGGGWNHGAVCGSRCRYADGGRAFVGAGVGGRGSSRVVRGA